MWILIPALIAVVMLVVLTRCTTIDQLWRALAVSGFAFLAACSDLFGPAPRVTLSLHMENTGSEPPSLVALVGPPRAHVTPPAEEQGFTRASTAVRGPGHRFTYPVRVLLRSSSGDTLATVQFDQRFEREHNHWISGTVGHRRPFGHCIGQLVLAPLRNSSAHTLFVTYGGLPRGSVC